MSYCYQYPRPSVTVDLIIIRPGAEYDEILLIQRGREPFQGSWSLPGGFVDQNEDLTDAAQRELKEETNVDIKTAALIQIGAFGKPGRDPRGHIITVAYAARVDSQTLYAKAGDDAAEAKWYPLNNLPKLAFDHCQIIEEAVNKLNVKS